MNTTRAATVKMIIIIIITIIIRTRIDRFGRPKRVGTDDDDDDDHDQIEPIDQSITDLALFGAITSASAPD